MFALPLALTVHDLRKRSVRLLIACLCVATAIHAADAEPTAQQLQFFETRIRPLLVDNCLGCHGPKKQWASLRLDRPDFILKGGESGPAAVAGQPEKSLLIEAVRQTGDIVMPPEGQLSASQIADLEKWIKEGLPFPAQELADVDNKGYRDPDHWSFQPRQSPPLPEVQQSEWVHNGIDRWILARLEAEGLQPAEPASRRDLLRRVTFDLTGLPPTPEEMRHFLSDAREGAYGRVVDRLLASSAYGERWGRHWLDVARYADSNGLDENVAHGNAWKYRDYVISAFNRDLPYDQFIIQQLAGDLLPAQTQEQRYEQLIATGFLSLGAKVIAEVDENKMQMDIIDEQLDTLGRTFMGLTLGCARCHDHKFDPITTANYYGLAGILKSTKTMESFKKVAKWYENPLPDEAYQKAKSAHEARVAEAQKAVADFVTRADEAVLAQLTPGATVPEKKETLYSAETKAELKKLQDQVKALEKEAPEMPSAMGVAEAEVCDVAIHLRGSHLKLGDVAPRHVPEVIRGVQPPQFSNDQSGRLELARWLVDPAHPLTSRVIVNRVWRWHFGRGLVASPDNFGVLGDRPSHPELLDWLSNRLIEEGWSLKWLHRQIVMSSTYRQSTHAETAVIEHDLENKLYSRFPVRRLEAEEVRDALLAVSGQLDRRAGGPVLAVKNRGYLFDHTSKDMTSYDSRRRSVYLPVIRNNVYDLFQLLDFPDPATPSGDRSSTTVAPQALLMLNSDLVMNASDALAERVLQESGVDADRIRILFQLAVHREISGQELEQQLEFLKSVTDALQTESVAATNRQQLAWSILCQAVLASNEFLYLN